MNNQIKILMVGPDAQGGITSVIKSYFKNGLSDDALFLPSATGGNAAHKILFFLNFLVKYLWILTQNKSIKLVHIQCSSKTSFLRKSIILYIGKIYKKKVILHIHGSEFDIFYEKSSNYIKRIIKYSLNKSDLILALSEQWRNKLLKITENANIMVLYNPITIKEYNYNKSNTVNVLFMGRLGKRKGTYDIIEAAKYLKNPAILIELYGDGNIEEFKKIVKDNNLEEKVRIMGWISGPDKDKVFQDADIYILPSYNEGLPISVLEAMANGLPVITTPVGGTPEAVEEGINGFLIDPGDCKTLAEKIDLLTNDKNLRIKMGKEGYRIAKEKFDTNIILRQLKNIYGGLVNESE